ncbi:hypothetical protein GCM10017771_86280 [Streptomyces capitiformicae]|uniref:Uncharacterized protein n=1 Tax=Streptomyces capitiformicae TaxID=2014920 RepID=A0A918ZQB6_9ACTN|nr:hypothetical protein GCM10017771_86280 [Streptomyces capitiformicae]
MAVSQLAAHARTLKLVTVTDAAHLARIHETACLVQAGASPYAVVDQVGQQLVEILGLRGCRFEHGTLLGRHPRLEQDGSLTVGRANWDLDKDGWPGEEIELRASVGGRYLGRFMLLPEPGAVPPPLQARLGRVAKVPSSARRAGRAASWGSPPRSSEAESGGACSRRAGRKAP